MHHQWLQPHPAMREGASCIIMRQRTHSASQRSVPSTHPSIPCACLPHKALLPGLIICTKGPGIPGTPHRAAGRAQTKQLLAPPGRTTLPGLLHCGRPNPSCLHTPWSPRCVATCSRQQGSRQSSKHPACVWPSAARGCRFSTVAPTAWPPTEWLCCRAVRATPRGCRAVQAAILTALKALHRAVLRRSAA